jgi:hypothetical protein
MDDSEPIGEGVSMCEWCCSEGHQHHRDEELVRIILTMIICGRRLAVVA